MQFDVPTTRAQQGGLLCGVDAAKGSEGKGRLSASKSH